MSDVRPARRSGSPADQPVTAPYEVVHFGGQAAVIVPLAEFLRLRALESTASAQTLQDAEDAVPAQDWLARETSGETNYVPLPQVRHRLRPPTEPQKGPALVRRQVPLDEAEVSKPPCPQLSWNQTWRELWFPRVISAAVEAGDGTTAAGRRQSRRCGDVF